MNENDEFKFLKNLHRDFIHDTAFNFYGTRMASCSSDGYVRVCFYHFSCLSIKWFQFE